MYVVTSIAASTCIACLPACTPGQTLKSVQVSRHTARLQDHWKQQQVLQAQQAQRMYGQYNMMAMQGEFPAYSGPLCSALCASLRDGYGPPAGSVSLWGNLARATPS